MSMAINRTQPLGWDTAMGLLSDMKVMSNYSTRLEKLNSDNNRLMLACGFYLGLRISDILRLTWEQIAQDKFVISEKKTSKARTIFVDPGFRKVYLDVVSNFSRQPSGLVFTYNREGSDRTKPISVTAANKRIKKVFTTYNVTCEKPSSHTLRKTFGRRIYEVYNKTEDSLILLSQIFNHGDISTTRRYIGLTDTRIARAYLSLGSGIPDNN